jgi:hypothetical protein
MYKEVKKKKREITCNRSIAKNLLGREPSNNNLDIWSTRKQKAPNHKNKRGWMHQIV